VPIPGFTEHGYLPAGQFHCNLAEVDERFGGNDRRRQLLGNLFRFLAWLRDEHGVDLPYYVDGSYTTAKESPGDIDFVIDISQATRGQIGAVLTLFSLEREKIKKDYCIDFWYYHPDADKDLRGFFQYVRVEELQARQLPMDTRKGILRIEP
jgi:hypothetical protein